MSEVLRKVKDEGEVDLNLEESYRFCREINENHYENFTVVSQLLPRDMRKYVHAFYAYCRYTDDLGDEYEGDSLQALDEWEDRVKEYFTKEKEGHPILTAVRDTGENFGLSSKPFLDIIEANRMDQVNDSYRTYEELLHYCDYSANPVGRVFLNIFGYGDKERMNLSDKTCTGLQLANFWQDVSRDLEKGRVYIPLEDMEEFDYSRRELENRVYNQNFASLMKFQVDRARSLLKEGRSLVDKVDDRIKVDIELFNLGGLKILEKIERIDYDVLHQRPTFSKPEKVGTFLKIGLKHGWKRLFSGNHE